MQSQIAHAELVVAKDRLGEERQLCPAAAADLRRHVSELVRISSASSVV
jgi:hypothetical protein